MHVHYWTENAVKLVLFDRLANFCLTMQKVVISRLFLLNDEHIANLNICVQLFYIFVSTVHCFHKNIADFWWFHATFVANCMHTCCFHSLYAVTREIITIYDTALQILKFPCHEIYESSILTVSNLSKFINQSLEFFFQGKMKIFKWLQCKLLITKRLHMLNHFLFSKLVTHFHHIV